MSRITEFQRQKTSSRLWLSKLPADLLDLFAVNLRVYRSQTCPLLGVAGPKPWVIVSFARRKLGDVSHYRLEFANRLFKLIDALWPSLWVRFDIFDTDDLVKGITASQRLNHSAHPRSSNA